MTEIIIAVLGSGVLSTLISQLFALGFRRMETKQGYEAALRLLMKNGLRGLCSTYIRQGWIYEDELEDIIDMHQCYHNDLKGNGYLDTMMDKVKALEVRGVGQ